jgi:hypothetical protein
MIQYAEDRVHMPVDLCERNGQYYVVSFDIPRIRFTEPFFIDTLFAHFNILQPSQAPRSGPHWASPNTPPLDYDMRDPRVIFVPIEDFVVLHDPRPIPNTHFLFHMSRCGSTLITQMLSVLNRAFVLSQPLLITKLLSPLTLLPSHVDRRALLFAAISGISACAPHECDYIFFKFESWNVFYLDYFAPLFPDATCCFVHRNGLEVLMSILRRPSLWLRSRHSSGPIFARHFEIESIEAIHTMPDDEYVARMLGAFCRFVANRRSSIANNISYESLPRSLPTIVQGLWKYPLSDADESAMLIRSRLNTKDPASKEVFNSDAENKRRMATPLQTRLACELVEPFRRLLY